LALLAASYQRLILLPRLSVLLVRNRLDIASAVFDVVNLSQPLLRDLLGFNEFGKFAEFPQVDATFLTLVPDQPFE
jgi:hypothetical protein